ncbi:hypothetical protein IIB49_01885 [Patescibacteria group bacterium]|nr:hypothetical protein [Patescibacteria group bacterium]
MDNLEDIRKKKLEELQSAQQAPEEEQLLEQLQKLEGVVKQSLTKEALERYGNLKIAYPEKTTQLLVILANVLQSGQLEKIDDNTLKDLLKKLSPEKKDIKIKRV